MKLGSVFMSWTLYLSPVMLWAALTLLAANLETLQCDGPISTRESSCHTDADPRDDDYEIKAYTFSEPFHLIVSYAPSGSAAPPTLNPAPQKSAAPETTPTEPPGPPPPQPTPASEDSGFSSPLRAPDPHLYHRMGLLLQHIQDVRALLGHLVIELRDLSGHLKPGATKAPAK
ncbi:Fc receptor-like A isoform X6 [Lepus europaeus]|uniref:Fc receptor-like A isoform X6 n=1 Tax=Lepus europaeus TaxID=9983 RepID=UPI002B48C584|nr:Fc receptor-like A isoform X6 [Lepus europaeus]